MKMKKILALGVVAMMAFSTVANAAVYDVDGYASIDKMPTKADVEARKANIVVDANKVSLERINALGITSLGRGKPALNEEIHDFYEITVDMTNIGDLIDGSEDAEPYPVAKIQLSTVNFYLNGICGTDILAQNISGGKLEETSWTVANTVNDLYNALVLNMNRATNVYPQAADPLYGTFVENFGFGTITVGLVVNEGVEFTSTPTLEITYSTTYNGAKDSPVAKTFNLTSTTNGEANNGTVVLKAAAPAAAKRIDFTAKETIKTETGYIWALTFTEYANLATMSAKFETATESADRTFNNVDAIVTALGGMEAPYTLNVGLITNKILTKATFTGDDADDTTDACVAEVKYE